MLPKVEIWSDGGCVPNPGPGGWGCVLRIGTYFRELKGGCRERTTNNRMELQAAIEALSALTRPCQVTLHSDSQYVVNGMTAWIHNWKRKGWIKAGQPLKNKDLWQKLDEVAAQHEVEYRWVKGHAGNVFNERCDQLATMAMEELRA